MQKFEHYFDAVHFLEGLNNLPMQNDYMNDGNRASIYIKRMRYFLTLIGNPDAGMRFIHITGTSGKGTVTNMLHEILNTSGQNVGSFSSPSVTTLIEKIKVKENFIAPKEFADIVEYLKPYIDKAYQNGPYGRPSHFEICLAIAFLYFKRQKCTWVILEVGLGGRFDATNVIERPHITAITNIDYDHTELLGKTLKEIAYDKAGIIKSGSVLFTAEQRPALKALFSTIASTKRVPIYYIRKQSHHTAYNEALVSEIAHYIGITAACIKKGIQRSRLACRFETVAEKPRIILDGAHNRAKIQSTVYNLNQLSFKKLFVIIGITNTKDHLAMLEQIIPLADHVFFTKFQQKDRRAAHPLELYKKSRKYFKKGTEAVIHLDAWSALTHARSCAKKNDVILAVGSFFLAGELRKHWISENYILEKRTSF